MIDWLHDNWLAVSALIVAFVGGWPGILKIIAHFRPHSLSGSVKFYAFTHSSAPPEDGILFGLSIINEGTKNLIWRKVKGKLKKIGTTIVLNPKMIPTKIVVSSCKIITRPIVFRLEGLNNSIRHETRHAQFVLL